ncbi:hypothetical protein MUK60_07400 [Streptomyces sp. LRE541]|uniref:hypothetical protein n=1 Tax=Streptomyces sp. LRE541 TaxID=2931983 RepID=UPI00200D1415|nr:hypothetical protein [Streptomyces sp. LRE541]UPZ27658.1 hypothetical protein MUK60_07400 [Streptomyces sp. LRE541]
MISTPPRTIPVPDAVAALSAAQLPARVRDAVTEAADTIRLYATCRGPHYTEARQGLEARIARANKTVAAFNPGLVAGPGDLLDLRKEER